MPFFDEDSFDKDKLVEKHESDKDPIKDEDWREILDLYLEGKGIAGIAKMYGRTDGSITSLLSKIARNYDEDGKRTSALARLLVKPSRLDVKRDPSPNTYSFLRDCVQHGRTVKECAVILRLTMKRVRAMIHETGKQITPLTFGL